MSTSTARRSPALWFGAPFVGVLAIAGAAAVVWSMFRISPCDTYTDVDFFDLEPSVRCVKTSVMAHYGVVLKQNVPGNGFFEDKTFHVFGLFPPGNTEDREIRILARTERSPEGMVDLEAMTISGRLLPLDTQKIPFDTESRIGDRSNYFFSDLVYILEPDIIEVKGEPTWTRLP